MRLTDEDQARLRGENGPGVAMAMRVLIAVSEAMGAQRLLDIVAAHVDGCLYHGQAGTDFARRLVKGGASTVVPTTLNVGSLDLLHPERVLLSDADADAGRALMDAYTALGCRPTWTCAPYQLTERPGFGDQIAWAESNAIVFANSVLGARTERYGDFMDICAAVTGRAPAVGLHLDQGRRPRAVLVVDDLGHLVDDDAVYPLIGHVLGRRAGGQVVAIVGLDPATSEDRLKAIGASAAASGSVAMFHAVGVTPEAPDEAELMGKTVLPRWRVGPAELRQAARDLSSRVGGTVDVVALGTPHYSPAQLERLADLLEGRRCRLPLYVNTARHIWDALATPTVEKLVQAGVTVVTDTCTYLTPIIDPAAAVVMTDSAKWAYYAPANLGVEVVYGSVEACVEAAISGRAVDPW